MTFIVPAYNSEKYIGDCLQSLVNQTVVKHKVIIVNDGSTDRTGEICIQYRERYPELIHYIQQENRGLGEARNVGMREVDSPYLTFLDSDDWLNTKYVERFCELISDTDEAPDLVFTLPWIYNSVTHRISPWYDHDLFCRVFEVQKDGSSGVQTNTGLKPELYDLEVNACRKIYRTSFLREQKFSFPKSLKWEDVPGHFYLLHEANTCMALPEAGFFYRINHGGSITAGIGETHLDMLPIFRELLTIQKEQNFTREEQMHVIRLILNFSRWSVEVTNQKYIGELLKGLHEIYRSFDEEVLQAYLNSLSPDPRWETSFLLCIRSDAYEELGDYSMRSPLMEQALMSKEEPVVSPRKRHNVFYGGVQCMLDHGISYTFFLGLRKIYRALRQF